MDTGGGAFLECAMIEGALNVAAEQVIEFTAYGNLMARQGNRTAEAAPQGLLKTRAPEGDPTPRWLALSIATVEQWDALLGCLDHPEWSRDWSSAELARRKSGESELLAHLAEMFAGMDRDELVEKLRAAGVPAAVPADPRALSSHPQFVHRKTYEELVHPVVGSQKFIGMPFRFASVSHWLREPAPLLGEHNEAILQSLGLSEEQIEDLRQRSIIGTVPEGL